LLVPYCPHNDDMTQTPITQTPATLQIPRKGGHIEIAKVEATRLDCEYISLTDHGTSSCVDAIYVFEISCIVNWGGKMYAYAMTDPARALGEFVLTLSLGKTANWIKENCTEVSVWDFELDNGRWRVATSV
jgi:hypothetical protein